MTVEFDFERYEKGLERQSGLVKWLSGNGPYTEEEENIRQQFKGKNADLTAKQAIAIHRKSQAASALSGKGELSEEEQQIVNGISDQNQGLIGGKIVGLNRRMRLIKYLKGDDKENLLK